MVIFSGIFIENERNMNGRWENWGPKWAAYDTKEMGKSSHSKRLDIAFQATALLSRELDVAGGAGFRVGVGNQ